MRIRVSKRVTYQHVYTQPLFERQGAIKSLAQRGCEISRFHRFLRGAERYAVQARSKLRRARGEGESHQKAHVSMLGWS